MTDALFDLSGFPVTPGLLLGVAGVILLAGLLVATLRLAETGRSQALQQTMQGQDFEARLGEIARVQAEAAGRMQAMGEVLAGRQAELARSVSDGLSAVSHRLGQSMTDTTRQTADRLQSLHERLAVIDNAHRNIAELASQVTSLSQVLSNKQTRGAFGQARMEAIVRDGLPAGGFSFQRTLSNGKRPDCVVELPDGRPLVIDSKFPLEAVTALREAPDEAARKAAAARLRQDVAKHMTDIAEKYLLAGETQDTALMFVPSESVYADIHEGFDDLVQKAYRLRVVMVSPSLLMLAIQVTQQILKDHRMREAADKVREEVGLIGKDIGLLRDRVAKLQTHFDQASEDVRMIKTSSDKIERRAERLNTLDFDEAAGGAGAVAAGGAAASGAADLGPAPFVRLRKAAE